MFLAVYCDKTVYDPFAQHYNSLLYKNPVIVIIRFMLSFYLNPIEMPLSGLYLNGRLPFQDRTQDGSCRTWGSSTTPWTPTLTPCTWPRTRSSGPTPTSRFSSKKFERRPDLGSKKLERLSDLWSTTSGRPSIPASFTSRPTFHTWLKR